MFGETPGKTPTTANSGTHVAPYSACLCIPSMAAIQINGAQIIPSCERRSSYKGPRAR